MEGRLGCQRRPFHRSSQGHWVGHFLAFRERASQGQLPTPCPGSVSVDLTFTHSRCSPTDTMLGTFWTLHTFNNCTTATLASRYYLLFSPSLSGRLVCDFLFDLCIVSLSAFFRLPSGWVLSLVSSTDLPITAETGSCLLSNGSQCLSTSSPFLSEIFWKLLRPCNQKPDCKILKQSPVCNEKMVTLASTGYGGGGINLIKYMWLLF